LPFYVYCQASSASHHLETPGGSAVFAPGEFESHTQAEEIIQRTQQLLATFEPSPDFTAPVWEIVEADSLEAARVLVALRGQPPSPN
jgi:hypothetical protein